MKWIVANKKSLIGTVSPNSQIEQNLKTVYEIYSSTWMQGEYAFSSIDSLALFNIGLQSPVSGGIAVYHARVMLDLSVDYFGSGNTERQGQFDNLDATVDGDGFEVFPNPTDGSITFVTSISEEQKVIAEVYDLSGRLVLSEHLAPDQESYQMSLNTLEAGVYTLCIVVNGETLESKRIVIVK